MADPKDPPVEEAEEKPADSDAQATEAADEASSVTSDEPREASAESTDPADASASSMCCGLLAWLEDRTGITGFVHEMLFERIPGGARWRYVWGSTLIFAFVVQAITGTVLWMHYSPSDTTAWESVHYISHHMQGGWLLRGIHHFMAQAMVVLLLLHMLQVVIDGAYKAPREVNFWLGLILMQIVLGLSLTGYLLPWDQKGYWATRVATNLMGLVPGVGTSIQELVVGGKDYNHHTVTRFFALHAGVLPALLVMFVAAHVAVFRRHGVTPKLPLRGPDQYFWPDQVLKDGVACLAVMAAVLGLTVYFGGAELTAPADGAREYSAARPEWYFLFLFQFLKLFEGWGHIGEILGAIVIPGLAVGFMFLMPFIARAKHGHAVNIAFLALLIVGAGVLTGWALYQDGKNLDFQNAKWVAHEEAKLAEHLATTRGIPPQGMNRKLRRDPMGIALRTISNDCLKCHSYLSPTGEGNTPERPTAPNLYGFGTAQWAEGLLDAKQIVEKHYFGNTNLKDGDMVKFVTGKEPPKEHIEKVAVALAAEAQTTEDDEPNEDRLLLFAHEEFNCLKCHTYHGEGDGGEGLAPKLDGWGSTRWLMGMISNPNRVDMYGHLEDDQQMPAFGKVADDPHAKNLDPEVIREIARWMRGEWYKEGE